MILLDDLLVKPFTSVLRTLHSMAVRELYDTDAIRSTMKENRLLYELGERSEAEYQRRDAELQAELETAELAREVLDERVEVKR